MKRDIFFDRHPRLRRQAGMTMLEMIAVTGLLSFLVIALFCLFSTANHLFRAGDVSADIDEQARLALTQITGELKQTGFFTDDISGKTYPYFFDDGNAEDPFSEYTRGPAQHQAEEDTPAYGPTREIIFRLAEDVDGNGYKTDACTGKIEWGPDEISYQIRTGSDGVNRLEKRVNNASPVIVASYVERITFDDIYTDPTVPFGQVRVIIHMRKKATDGRIVKSSYATKVKMRNFERED